MSILPYTPGNMSYEELKSCFVGRESLLNELLDTLAEQAQASTLQHWMILGNRGMGKTHLTRLFYYEILKNENISKLWFPIVMNEEEPEVFNLPTLFIRFLQVLAESLENNGNKEDAGKITEFLDSLRYKVKVQSQLLDYAVNYLKQFSVDHGKRIVVLLENADDLLTKCLPDETDAQKLRKILSVENFILIIGASPTFFPRISKPKGVFYDFFRLRRLELLSFQQSLDLLQKWAQQEKDEARIIAFKKKDYRLRVMYHLTGGNPRLLYFLYKAITDVDSLIDASSTFEAMLEKDLTAYYLSRMRDIPNQVQPIVVTLAKSEKNLTQKEIALQSFLPERSMGTQIQRLEDEDVVKAVSGKKGKNTIYTLTDYLFRVWYQWRYSKQKKLIQGLVEFLAIWFSQHELEKMCNTEGIAGQYYMEALAFRSCDFFHPHLEAVLEEGAKNLHDFAFKGEFKNAASILASIGEYSPNRRESFREILQRSGLSDDPENIEKVMKERIAEDSEDFDAWKWLGRALNNQGNPTGAEEAFNKSVDLKDDDPETWRWFGVALGNRGNHTDAEKAFQKSVDLKDDDPGSWILLGIARGNQGDYTGAAEAFQKSLDLKDDDPETWKWLGRARINQSNYKDAEEALQKSVDLKNDDPETWKWLGGALNNQSNPVGAEEAFQKSLDLKDDDPVTWEWLGGARNNQGNHTGAVEAFQKSLDLKDDDPETWKWLGRARINQGNYKDAEEALQKSVDLKNDDPETWKWLGTARINQSNYKGAEEAFQKSVDLKNDDPAAWKWLGGARNDQDNYKGAEEAFQKSVDLKNDDPETWKWLGGARINQGNHTGAVEAFQKSADLKDDDPEAWEWLGLVLVLLEDYAGAVNVLKKSIELDPEELNSLNVYSCALFRSNHFQEAIKAQHQILERDRYYTEAYFDLCIFHILTGSVKDISNIMESILQYRDTPNNLKTQVYLFYASCLLHEGDKKAFSTILNSGIHSLEISDEESRRNILNDLSRFLVDAISSLSINSVKIFIEEFQKRTENSDVLSIIRPLTHVLEYAEACITHKNSYSSKEAQNALDRVPGELKGPVEEMAATVRKNLKWQSKVLNSYADSIINSN